MKPFPAAEKALKRGHRSWLLLFAVAATGGCSGIQATKSISPLDFLLPGLHMRNEPCEPVAPAGTNMVVCQLEAVGH